MGTQEIRIQGLQMFEGSLSFRQAMRPVWIGHHGELTVMFYQFIDEHLRILIMYVFISRTMNEKQVAF